MQNANANQCSSSVESSSVAFCILHFAFCIAAARLLAGAAPPSERHHRRRSHRTQHPRSAPRQRRSDRSGWRNWCSARCWTSATTCASRPSLAERLDNPDPLTYIAHLRHGVKFHDGHELTSRDVVFTFNEILDPAFVSPFKGAFRALEDVARARRLHVVFTLKRTVRRVSDAACRVPPIVPAGAGTDLATHPIGTGPYRFVRYDVDDQAGARAVRRLLRRSAATTRASS